MKTVILLIISDLLVLTISLVVIVIILKRNNSITQVTWTETKDWSIVDGKTGKTYAIEFGFSDNGSIQWRRGKETTK